MIVMVVTVFREHYSTEVSNEVVCYQLLMEKELLKSAGDNVPCRKCDIEMQEKQRKCLNGN